VLHLTLQQKAIVQDLKRIGKDRCGYEQIQEVIVRLEPFTIASGLMTQTLKVCSNHIVLLYTQTQNGICDIV
jgi:long-subunit acyl-CoA synthetase (AMP-forming)